MRIYVVKLHETFHSFIHSNMKEIPSICSHVPNVADFMQVCASYMQKINVKPQNVLSSLVALYVNLYTAKKLWYSASLQVNYFVMGSVTTSTM